MHARIYDFTLGAGGMQRLPVVGDFFKVISATGTINVNVDTGATLDLLPGQGLREFKFNTLTITDKSGAENTGKVLVGFSGMIDDRVTGEVSVIDGAASRVYSGVSFSTYQVVTAVAGMYPALQLWNPPGSGKDLVVSGMALSLAGADGYVAISGGKESLGGLSGSIRSKKIGGAASVAETRLRQDGVFPGTSTMFEIYMRALDGQYIRLNEPFVLLPGNGLHAFSGVNQGLSVSFDFYEKVIG